MIFIIFLLAFLLRIALAIFAGQNPNVELGDISTVKNWSLDLWQKGFAGFFERGQFFPYPPLANYFFYSLAGINKIFTLPAGIIYRLPNIISDLLTAWVLYLLVKKKSLRVPAFYLFNPATLYITAYWGQWDSLMTLFLVLSFYRTSLFFWLLSFLVKPQALPFLFPLLGLYLVRKKFKNLILGTLLCAAVFFVAYYPFFPDDPFFGPFNYLQKNLVSFAPRFTSSGFNFWYLIYGGWRDDFPEIFSLSVEKWSKIITLGFLAFSLFGVAKTKNLFRQAIGWAIAGWSFFLFFTQVKERYFFATLPFLILGMLGKKPFLVMAACLLFTINSIGFFEGWINHGYWNSTLLSVYNLDKIIALFYLLSFLYLLYFYVKEK